MTDQINESTLRKRAAQSAQDLTPALPKENTVEAWQAFIDELDDLDVYDLAHAEADSWDWVIYYHMSMELCTNVWSTTLHQAESDCEEMGGFGDVGGLYELACKVAYWIVRNAVVEELEALVDELKELAENQIENLGAWR